MPNFVSKLNTIAKNTDSYLKNIFLKHNRRSYLMESMKYGVFSVAKDLGLQL